MKVKESIFALSLTLLSVAGFSDAALAETVYTICDDCSATEKDRRAKDVIAGNDQTYVMMGDIATKTVVRYSVIIMDLAQGVQYKYVSETLSPTSFEYSEFEKLWNVVEKLPQGTQSHPVPVEIAETPWDLLGNVAKQDEVLDWYRYEFHSVFNSDTWIQGLEMAIAGFLPKFLGSYAIRVYFEDGGFVVLRAKGWTSGPYGPTIEFEIDLEASRDGNGNQIVPVSGDSPIIGSMGNDTSFSSAARQSNFIISGSFTFPASSVGGGVCSIKVTAGEVIVTCKKS